LAKLGRFFRENALETIGQIILHKKDKIFIEETAGKIKVVKNQARTIHPDTF